MKSMTGYGQGQALGQCYRATVEMRSVNHRYLEFSMRLPKQLQALEERLKKQAQAQLQRGKVDISLSFEQIAGKKIDLALDKDLAIAYHKSLMQLADITGLPLTMQAENLALLPGVIVQEKAEDDIEELAQLLESALGQALAQLTQMRQAEGLALAADIRARLAHLRRLAAAIAELVPQVQAEQRQRLHKRLAELLEQVPLDENRLANEVAYLADKSDIAEELTRLSSHADQLEAALSAEEAVGRRLDFLLQEMNREINTIGSKSNALEISNLVIDAKSELEKIREQVQNIE